MVMEYLMQILLPRWIGIFPALEEIEIVGVHKTSAENFYERVMRLAPRASVVVNFCAGGVAI